MSKSPADQGRGRPSESRSMRRSNPMIKQAIYFPWVVRKEMVREAKRLGRPFPWVVRKALRMALAQIAAFDSEGVSR